MTAYRWHDPAELAPTRITVTAGHIESGVRESCERCPIALAILEATGDPLAEVAVDADEITLYRGSRAWFAKPPVNAGDFVVTFDQGGPVEPFGFELTWTEVGPPA